ncbi:MAG: glycosyltransferase [Flavobacteriales bacterium]|nr:glycosyltransferase [Flavobacteriales bacterium]
MDNNFTLDVPVNPTSLGQLGCLLLRESYEQGLEPNLNLISDLYLEHEKKDPKFFDWINNCRLKFLSNHTRDTPTVRLWHINQSQSFLSHNQALFTFHELDSLTDIEKHILEQQDRIIVACDYNKSVFEESLNKEVSVINLPFDKYNFSVREKKSTGDNRITFCLVGKYEPLRKRHNKVIQAWLQEFGDNSEYDLVCVIGNQFYEDEEYKASIRSVVKDSYFNIQFIPWVVQNNLYNETLNHCDIVIGMGNESWGLPEFNAIALGKYGVISDYAGHTDWANSENSHLVPASNMIPADNDKFFVKGGMFNQGNFFDFDEKAFIESCYNAISSYKENNINTSGLKLQEQYTTKTFLENIKNTIA